MVLASRLAARAETIGDVSRALARAVDAASRFRDSSDFVEDLTGEIIARATDPARTA